MSLSEPVMSVLCAFESASSQPTWQKVQVLILGALSARGRRTVPAALHQIGLCDASNFSLYHHVLTRDPKGRLAPRAYFSTCLHDQPSTIVHQFIKRWNIETTFEEGCAHLGLETPRQWSDRAIERTTPCLLGLYSVVALLAHALHPDAKVPVQGAAWYPKAHATFAVVWAAVRQPLWGVVGYSTSVHAPDLAGIPGSELSRLVEAVRYSH